MRHALVLVSAGSLAVVALLGSGCARSTDVKYYNLNPVAVDGAASPDLAIAVGPVEFPKALDRTLIATRVGPYRLRYDEYNRWAGTLAVDFVNTVGTNLSRMLGTDRIVVYPDVSNFPIAYRVTFAVQRFDADPAGDVTLEARWVLIDTKTQEALVVRQFATTQPATGDDYDARAAAHSDAVAALSREIAAEIQAQ